MKIAMLLLVILFLWSCNDSSSNNDHEEINSDPITSIDPVLEPTPEKTAKVQQKILVDPDISNENLVRYVANWAVSLRDYISVDTIMIVFTTGQYKAILRTNTYGASDTTKVPTFFWKFKKQVEKVLPEATKFPENIIHEWYEDSTITDQKTYLWFKADIEQAMIEIDKNSFN